MPTNLGVLLLLLFFKLKSLQHFHQPVTACLSLCLLSHSLNRSLYLACQTQSLMRLCLGIQ